MAAHTTAPGDRVYALTISIPEDSYSQCVTPLKDESVEIIRKHISRALPSSHVTSLPARGGTTTGRKTKRSTCLSTTSVACSWTASCGRA